jgi:hypothetical protein
MNDLTIEQLVTIERALHCFAVTHLKNASYHAHSVSLEWAMSGGDGKPVQKAQEILAIVSAEIERRKITY